MNDPAIAQIIREVLAEELSKIRGSAASKTASGQRSVHEELVSIGNDAELNNFVRRVLEMARNEGKRRAIEKGELVFRLSGTSASNSSGAVDGPATGVGSHTQIDAGVVSERQVDRLPRGTERLRIGKAVRLTPLAKDRLRQRGITIERMES
ncbi:MAG: hypothetical protein RIC16_12695 [Rhodospirillales bacterium]